MEAIYAVLTGYVLVITSETSYFSGGSHYNVAGKEAKWIEQDAQKSCQSE